MKNIVVVGASIAGLELAKCLANKNVNVIVIEKEQELGNKICAHGVVEHDLEYIPESFLNFPLRKAIIHYKKQCISFPKDRPIISSINRKEYLTKMFQSVKDVKNIQFLFGSLVKKIDEDAVFTKDRRIPYDILVGADGSLSVVRKYLKVPAENKGIAIQYFVSKKFNEFELFFDEKLFGTGYAWIFPNKDFTSIGCGSDDSVISLNKLKSNFEKWLVRKGIHIKDEVLQGAYMNYDYRGYHFGNKYLVGDAAGLTSGITGKGIYPALVSARQVANEILGIEKKNLIEEILKKKEKQERYMAPLKSYWKRKLVFSFGFRFLPQLEKKVLRNI